MKPLVLLTLCLAVSLPGCEPADPLGPTADQESLLAIREALGAGTAAEGGGDQTEVSTGTGWATIGGKFTLAPGVTPRARQPLVVNKDTGVCAPGGKAVLDEVLLVDEATRGIANIAVYLRKASRVHESAQPQDPSEFDQKDCVFLSHVFPVVKGQPVLVKNSDPVGHNTNISGKNSFNQTIPVGQSVTFIPQLEESYPVNVSCSIHPWMQAYMLPRDNGYFAVTRPDGSFEIANVPAGEELEFQVWHEFASGPGGGLPNGPQELKWSSRGRFKIKLDENETRSIDVVVPGTAFRG